MLAVINEETISKEMSNKNLKQVNKIKIGAWGYRQIGVGLVFGVDCCNRRIFSKRSNSQSVLYFFNMKKFKLFFVLLIGTLAITSCDNEVASLDNSSKIDCLGLTKAELAKVGTLHNQYVTEVYQKVDFLNCDDCSNEVIDAFSKIELDLSGVGKSIEEVIAEALVQYQKLEAIQFDLRNWTNHPFSSKSFVYLTKIMEEMDVMVNYDDFLTNMIQLQGLVDSDISLTCFDVELLTGTIEVAKNSAYLWLPRNNGGLDFCSISRKDKVQPRWSWRNAAKADVAASASYFMGNSILWAAGLAVPGTNAAILGGWALSAGFSSALGGL